MKQNISPTLNCQEIVNKRREQGLEVYDFGLGANPIYPPQFFIDAVKKYADKKEYTSCEGIKELNTTLKNIYKNNNTNYEILVGCGLKELLFIIQLAFEGKIFHITPSWVSYKEQIRILNKEKDLIEIHTNIENNYNIDLQLLEKKLKEYQNHKKIIIFNNPNNPLGLYTNNTETCELAFLLKKYNCLVISDEIYLNLTYIKGIKSIAYYIPELTIIGSSISKDLGCGGYRLGWLAFPKKQFELFNKCRSFSSSIYSCASTPIQYATSEMLKNKQLFNKHCDMSIEFFKNISNKVCEILKTTKIKFIKPNSCWYIFLNFSNYKNVLKKYNIKNSDDLCMYLINTIGFVTVPGSSFNSEGINLRLSFVDFDLTIDKDGIKIIKGINEMVYLLKNL